MAQAVGVHSPALGSSPVMPPPLEVRGVSRHHGTRLALDGVDLTVLPGEVHGLLGPNGAGKTTLLRLVLGLLRPEEGTVLLHGRRHDDPGGRGLDGVAGFVDTPRSWPYLTGRQTLRLLARLDDDPAAAGRVEPVLERVGLGERAGDRVAHYSTGMLQRLALAWSLLRDPRLLVLDEPTSGLDPAGVRDTGALLRQLASDGRAVLLSSHVLADVERLCDRVTVLREGRVLFAGRVEELRHRAAGPQHRLRTSDDAAAARLAPAVALVADAGRSADGGLVLRCTADELEVLVLALARQGVAVRQLVTETPSLEDVFLTLTGTAA